MSSILGRLLAALLWLPLAVSKPFLRLERGRARRRDDRRPSTDERRRSVKAGRRAEPAAGDAARRPPAQPVNAMLAELARVLNEEDTHRHRFRYLARFERKLRERGLRAMEEVPIKELRRALRDFETLVRNWSQVDLAELRSRMSVTLNDRSSAASVWITANSVTSEWKPSRELLAAHAAAAAAGLSSRPMPHP